MAGGGDWMSRARRVFGDLSISEAVAGVRQIIGPGKFPPGQEEAEEALENLRNGIEPSPRQLAALELMIRLMRPAIYSRKGALEPLPDFNQYAPGTVERWDRFRGLVAPRLYSIGRIDRKGGEPLGTGFVVAPRLLATNRHVVEALSFGVNVLEEGQGIVLFGQEKGTIEAEDPVPIFAVAAIHPTLDMALLRIRDPRTDRPSLELETEPAEEGTTVAAIGYPFEDSRSPLFADAIYHKDYGNKRAAPGEILERSGATFVYHDCSTLGGNSGSPLFSQETARVVGLHSSGFFTYRNEAVAAAQLGEFIATQS